MRGGWSACWIAACPWATWARPPRPWATATWPARRLEESLAIARQISDRTQEIFCLGHLGWLDVQEGQAAPALEHLRAALALAEQVNSCAEQPWLHAGLAEALRLTGDLDAAAVHARQALALADATGQAHDQRLAPQVAWRRL